MKKILSLVLVIVMMMSMTVTAFAAGEQSGTSTVTAVVPEPEYTIHIPADMTLEYGNGERQLVGEISVSDVKYLPKNRGITVAMTVTSLKSTNGDEIPVVFEYTRKGSYSDYDYEDNLTTYAPFVYSDDGEYKPVELYATVTEADWKAAKPGTYTSTITYDFKLF